jgi:hypothetical protein
LSGAFQIPEERERRDQEGSLAIGEPEMQKFESVGGRRHFGVSEFGTLGVLKTRVQRFSGIEL